MSGTRTSFIVTQGGGFPQDLPETYEEFLDVSRTLPNATRSSPYSFAWRGRNAAVSFNCKFAFATTDDDFEPFNPKILKGSRELIVTKMRGAGRRRTLLWGRNVLVNSVQFTLEETGAPHLESWSDYLANASASISDHQAIEKKMIPGAQLRLMSAMQTAAKTGRLFDQQSSEMFAEILDVSKLFNGLELGRKRSGKSPDGSRIEEEPIWMAAILRGGIQSSDKARSDEWHASPVVMPPIRRMSLMHRQLSADDSVKPTVKLGPLEAGIVVERRGYALDDDTIARFTRAAEHVTAHVTLLRHLRKFVDTWWDFLLEPPSWDLKAEAAGNFIRAWEQHTLRVTPLWALGANDVQVDPTIVDAMDRALKLNASWNEGLARLSDMVKLAFFVLKQDPPEVYLGRRLRGWERSEY